MKSKLRLIIIILLVVVFGNEIYKQATKKPISAKAHRLPCQKKVATFEKVLKPKLVLTLQQALKTNNYKIHIWADKSKYMKSVMFEVVDIQKIKNDFKSKISKYKTNLKIKKDTNVFIDIMVYENDKKDPGKKTARSKLYAGYIEVTFKVNKKNVYKIQTDFMDLKGGDIPQRVTCIVNSIITLGDKNEKN